MAQIPQTRPQMPEASPGRVRRAFWRRMPCFWTETGAGHGSRQCKEPFRTRYWVMDGCKGGHAFLTRDAGAKAMREVIYDEVPGPGSPVSKLQWPVVC